MRKILTATIFSLILLPAIAQHPASDAKLNNEQMEVMKTVIELFDAYRELDTARMAAVFTADAQLNRVGLRNGVPTVSRGEVSGFLARMAGFDKYLDEQVWNYTVDIDGHLASVWTEFGLWVDKSFSHCGVDSFLLLKSEAGWKIYELSDTNRREDCVVPPEIREKAEK